MHTRLAATVAVLFGGFLTGADEPAKHKPNAAELLKAFREADAVFTAEIGTAKPISQTDSIPPSIQGEVTFKDAKPLRGKAEGKAFRYSYREGTTKNLDLEAKGRVIVAVKQKGVLVIVPASEANLALAKKAEEKKEDEQK